MKELNLKYYAYLGDCVWELMMREISVLDAANSKELHKKTTEKSNMTFQATVLNKIQTLLTEEELEIIRRARNLPVPIARRHQQATYRQATALEALIGYWHKKDKSRLEMIFKKIREIFAF